MNVHATRIGRARGRMGELGVDVLLLSTGADLPYLTGYEAMPLERLTMLVLPADGDAVLVVPRLEAPRVVEQPDAFSIRAVGGDRRPDRGRRRARGRGVDRRDRRPDVGPLRARAAGRAARHALPACRRRHRAAAHREGRGRDRRAARRGRTRSTRSPWPCAPSASPAAARSTCTASSSSACSTPATSAPTSRSSPPGRTRRARTTIRRTA